jgi:hypothetical protein
MRQENTSMEDTDETTLEQDVATEPGTSPAVGQARGQGQESNVWRTVGIILAVLAVVVIVGAVFYGLATHPMFTAVLRDISIIVLALVTMITGLLLAILLFQLQSLIVLLRDEIQPILNSINETAGTVRGTTNFVSDSVVTPAIELASYVSGIGMSLKALFRGPSTRNAVTETPVVEGEPSVKQSGPSVQRPGSTN